MESKRPRIVIACLLCSLVVASTAQHPPRRGPGGGKPAMPPKLAGDLPEVVQRCFRNYGRLRYTGTRIVQYRQEGNRVSNREFLTVDGMRSRTEFSEDSPSRGQIIVETNRERQHFFPGPNEIQITPRMKDETIQRLHVMFGNKREGRWLIKVSDGGSLASRVSTVLTASDRQGNPFQKLWFDNETGLILKREIFDKVGTRIGSFEFTQVNFKPTISAGDFEIKRRGAKIVRPEDRVKALAQQHGFLPMRITDPDAVLQTARIIPSPDGKIFAQVYLVGGARLSFYQLSGRVNDNQLGEQLGRELKSYRWNEAGRTFVLIGDLDSAKLRHLAESVR